MPALDPFPRARMMRSVIFDKRSGCWIWTGTASADGYGRFKVFGRHASVHRWAYEHFVGPIPAGHQVDHLCKRTLCCNPDHLEAVTPQENWRRSTAVTVGYAKQTHCKWGHEFTEANTYIRKEVTGTSRTCKMCLYLSNRHRRLAAADLARKAAA